LPPRDELLPVFFFVPVELPDLLLDLLLVPAFLVGMLYSLPLSGFASHSKPSQSLSKTRANMWNVF
jgi:hypothetical protein